ncbi:hypothetical protein ACA910_020366 [Epithemia clementina (nom. ined.)]
MKRSLNRTHCGSTHSGTHNNNKTHYSKRNALVSLWLCFLSLLPSVCQATTLFTFKNATCHRGRYEVQMTQAELCKWTGGSNQASSFQNAWQRIRGNSNSNKNQQQQQQSSYYSTYQQKSQYSQQGGGGDEESGEEQQQVAAAACTKGTDYVSVAGTITVLNTVTANNKAAYSVFDGWNGADTSSTASYSSASSSAKYSSSSSSSYSSSSSSYSNQYTAVAAGAGLPTVYALGIKFCRYHLGEYGWGCSYETILNDQDLNPCDHVTSTDGTTCPNVGTYAFDITKTLPHAVRAHLVDGFYETFGADYDVYFEISIYNAADIDHYKTFEQCVVTFTAHSASSSSSSSSSSSYTRSSEGAYGYSASAAALATVVLATLGWRRRRQRRGQQGKAQQQHDDQKHSSMPSCDASSATNGDDQDDDDASFDTSTVATSFVEMTDRPSAV